MRSEELPVSAEDTRIAGRGLGLSVAVALFALACSLYISPISFQNPTTPQHIPAWAIDTTTVRHRRASPQLQVGAFTYGCQECHQMWPDSDKLKLNGKLHQDTQLHHGINRRCLNCHHPENRDAFVDDAGEEISWNDPHLVCAKCHGPVYRDWQHGAHGRSEGFWDTSRGGQVRRLCVDCHDPHRPPFPPLHPAPGPNTLREGRQDFVSHEEVYDPLHPSSGSKPRNKGP